MARRRHQSDSTRSARALQREQKLTVDLRFLSKRGKRPDPFNEKAVTRQAREIRQREALEKYYGRKVSRKQRDQLKARGFHTTKSKVVIDGPRDSRRKKIRGAKMSVLKDGTVKWSVGARRDFIYGMTKKEKKEFAKNPELFTTKILKRLRQTNPTLKKVKSGRIQKRLQWGAFQATKDFAPRSWETKTTSGRNLMGQTEKMKREGERGKVIDKLTGLHFVIHIPKKRKRNVKRSKRK